MCVRSALPLNQLTCSSNRARHNTGPTSSQCVLSENPQEISQCRCNSVRTRSVAPWHMLVSPFCIPARAVTDPHGSCLWNLHSAPLCGTGQAARHQPGLSNPQERQQLQWHLAGSQFLKFLLLIWPGQMGPWAGSREGIGKLFYCFHGQRQRLYLPHCSYLMENHQHWFFGFFPKAHHTQKKFLTRKHFKHFY